MNSGLVSGLVSLGTLGKQLVPADVYLFIQRF